MNDEDGNPFVELVEKPKRKPRAPAKDYRAIASDLQQTLRRIAKGYMTPEQLRRATERPGNPHYGLSYEEALEMAHENMQLEASNAVKRAGRL